MLDGLANFVNLMRNSLKGIDSPRQLAAGVVIGMFVGMVPKDSLLVVLFALLLLLSNANLVTGIISAVVFSWTGWLFDWLSHGIGLTVLTLEPLQRYLVQISEWPLVSWMRIENTVVTGSVIVGFLLAVPVYHASYHIFARYRNRIIEFVMHSRPARWILGYPSAELQES